MRGVVRCVDGVGSFSEDRPLGWDPVAEGNRAGDGMASPSRLHREGSLAFIQPLSLLRRQGRVAAPSVCCAVACILLAAAPTATPCFRRWRSGCVCCFFFSPLAGTLKKQNAALASPPFICRWQRSAPLQSSPLPLVGEPLAKPFTLRGLPKPPLGRGGGSASALTERLSPAAAHGQASILSFPYKHQQKEPQRPVYRHCGSRLLQQ